MRISTLSIGDELLTGEIVDTNASHIAAELFAAGVKVSRHLTVGDRLDQIAAALVELAASGDAVVVTGGLGPTEDDLTSAAAAQAAGSPLVPFPEALDHLRRFSSRLPAGLHPANDRQANLPEGAELIPNPLGTACGFSLQLGQARLFFLPGVPFEMKRMLEESVLPALVRGSAGLSPLKRVTLKLFGISEAEASVTLQGAIDPGSPVELAYCVRFPEVHLILRAPASKSGELAAAEAVLRERLAPYIFAENDQTMDSVLAALLRQSGSTVALAESCTGGMIAARITAQPGSSAYFLEGVVCYSNAAKSRLLQVPPQLIVEKGAVSAEVARAMALGARAGAGSDVAVSVTGIAGPDGGSDEKPVGTVYLGLAHRAGVKVQGFRFPGDRERVREMACFQALDWLRRHILEQDQTSCK